MRKPFRRQRKRPYALFVMLILILAVVAGAFTYYQFLQTPVCEDPSSNLPPVLSGPVRVTINNLDYEARNATFTNEGQAVAIGEPYSVTFRTLVFSDPSKPHLVGRECITDSTQPVTLLLEVAFQTDSVRENLYLQYGGDQPPPVPAFTSHTGPQAGVRWTPYGSHVTLLVRF